MKALMLVASALLLATACADTRTASQRPVAVAAEPSAEVRDAQQRLHALGLYNGPADGLWGPETRASVERYQQIRGLPATGRLDDSTRLALRGAAVSNPVTLSETTDVRTVQNRLRQLNFYNGPADGVWGHDTQLAVENFQRSRGLPVGQVTQATVTAMGLDPAAFPSRPIASAPVIREPLEPGVIRSIQQRLRQQGYYTARIDGVWGPATERALARFQSSRGLEATGHLNPTTASALGFDPNNLSLSAVPRR